MDSTEIKEFIQEQHGDAYNIIKTNLLENKNKPFCHCYSNEITLQILLERRDLEGQFVIKKYYCSTIRGTKHILDVMDEYNGYHPFPGYISIFENNPYNGVL